MDNYSNRKDERRDKFIKKKKFNKVSSSYKVKKLRKHELKNYSKDKNNG